MSFVDLPMIGNVRQRELLLRKVNRYHPYEPMFYRSDLWMHSNRLVWVVQSLVQVVQQSFPTFDPRYAVALAMVHDDHETYEPLGDVQLGDKLLMSEEQEKRLLDLENEAIAWVSNQFSFSKVDNFSYSALLLKYNMHLDMKKDIEGMVVKIADKWEGFMEAVHEVYAGNRRFLTGHSRSAGPLVNYPSKVLPPLITKNPILQKLEGLHPYFRVPAVLDWEAIVAEGRPHTVESIHMRTGYAPYDHWRKVSRAYGADTGIRWLTEKKE